MEDRRTPHLAILSSPGMGHLFPLAELARQLASHHKLSVTIIYPTNSAGQARQAIIDDLPSNVDAISLPPVTTDDLPPGTHIVTLIGVTMVRSLPSLHQVINSLASTTRLVALVVDFFMIDAFDVAREFGIAAHLFFPSSAMFLSFSLHLPTLDEEYDGEYRDLPEPLKLPGCIPLHGRDFIEPVQDRKNDAYGWILRYFKSYREADGIVLNSFLELETSCIKALREKGAGFPNVYPVGPFTRPASTHEESECLRWLGNQPCRSVLFVSFGSGGTLSLEQLHELAFGLEMSGHRFIWVIRSPNDKDASATYLSVESSQNPLSFLPQGFLSRTKEVGLVIPSWAPQVEVLSHKSTGGFFTHCGWNSTIESIVQGVPMIAWPLFAEQKMNAVMMVEELKVALRPAADERGVVGREEIAHVVKRLMAGEEGIQLRRRMEDLKDSSAKALDEGGSSYMALSEFAGKCQGTDGA